jgi:hypothetical protein
MAIISDVGSAEFYELRAIEEIHAARDMRISILEDRKFDGNEYSDARYWQHIVKAIQLLLLAKLNV